MSKFTPENPHKREASGKHTNTTTVQPHVDSLGWLMWRRFKRRRLGMVGGGLILLMTFLFLSADFVAPYDYGQNHIRAPSVPPMLDRIHWFDTEGSFIGPFVYGLARSRDPETGIWQYAENFSEVLPIRFFVEGEPYRFWGLFEANLHLFGIETNVRSGNQLFLLGSNQSGVDLLSQILVGGRISMMLVAVVILTSLVLGIIIGGLSGYLGGWVDTALQRVVEVTMALPRLALLLALSAAIPSNTPAEVRFWSIVGVLVLVNWAPLARVIRGQFLAMRSEDYVYAARSVGSNRWRIILRHILPNTMSYLVVAATLAVPNVLVLESVLSFLGFGLNVPLVSWGLLLKQVYEGFVANLSFYPWLILPGGFLFLTVMAFNLFGDALRDAVDPFTVDSGTTS